MTSPPPLSGLRVLELAGLAPGPFTGLLLADAGASVLRIDRAYPNAHTSDPPPPTPDNLVRHKSSIALDLKKPNAFAFFKSLIPHVDVLIDPYRPGVLEKLGLDPHKVLLRLNPRLIVARMVGFRPHDGKYKDMAGHDINYLAVSGLLSMLGPHDAPPSPPGNVLGDFAGGGAVCFMGVLMALLSREGTGSGQVVEANMVDGAAYLGTFLRLNMKTPMWDRPRGTNALDGGSPFYQCYETKDGGYMSVGALEPQFFAQLINGLGLSSDDLPDNRLDRSTWPRLKTLFEGIFRSKTRSEWETIFDGTDACVTPVLGQKELEDSNYDQRPIVGLSRSPLLAVSRPGPSGQRQSQQGQGPGVVGEGWTPQQLSPGAGGEQTLQQWLGWTRGRDYDVDAGSLVSCSKSRL